MGIGMVDWDFMDTREWQRKREALSLFFEVFGR